MATPDPAVYRWDADDRVFLDQHNRRVDRKDVRASLDRYIDTITSSIRTDTQALVDGNLSIEAWHLKMENHIRRAHVGAVAIAKGGHKQATSADWAFAGRQIKEQYQYLYRFSRQLEAGRPVNGGTVSRAEMYGLSATRSYEGLLRRDDLLAMFDLERRLLHSQTPCDQCAYYAELGWVVAGTLPGIGEQCACLTRCRCSFERKRSAEAEKRWRDSRPKMPNPPKVKKPPLPKPPPVVIPQPTPQPKPPVAPPKVKKPPVVLPPTAKLPKTPEKAPEEPKPQVVEDTPQSRIEAARAAQRIENAKVAARSLDPYASLQPRMPDLLPPGPIQERLTKYTLGDIKVKEVAALEVKYELIDSDLASQRSKYNRELMDLWKEMDAHQAPYVGSSKKPSEKVVAKTLEIQAKIDAAEKKRDEIKVKQRGLQAEKRREAHKLLTVDKPAEISANSLVAGEWFHSGKRDYTDDPAMKLKVSEAVNWLKEHVAHGDVSKLSPSVGHNPGERAYFKDYNTTNDLISLSTETDVGTIIHEYGHGIEHRVTTGGVQAYVRSKEFLNYRVGNEPKQSMKDMFGGNYTFDEMGRKDKFDDYYGDPSHPQGGLNKAYYTGKEYHDGTEVLTMGMQALFDDPVGLAKKDPEWAKWVMGILDGSLR
jgi:hypothetical protein